MQQTARSRILKHVGEAVRALRDSKRLSRHDLAESSGVSERFLADLEIGSGNISVARLADVAHALGVTSAALLAGNAGDRGSTARATIDALLDGRSEAELREVRAWLVGRFQPQAGLVVALLGVRGAGKSTVGAQLARRLGLPFHELDALIEEAAGLTLAEIFELHGEAYYRRLERETLAQLLSSPAGAVVATGGSLVGDKETFKLLRRRAVTVWLKARAEDHWNRVIQQGDQRPMAKNPHAMQELRALLAAREPKYAEADHVIDTSKWSVDVTVGKLASLLKRS
jgi:XRE family transcriptional regulator, aerobic/anaerobic benzoate catabolism transcriptional regulator